MKKGNQGHGILSYLGRWVFMFIFGGITLFIIIWGLNDNWNHENQQNRNLQMNAVHTAENVYNQESAPLEHYVQQRNNQDLAKMSPQIKQLKGKGANIISSHTRTPVSNVSLDDSGNGTVTIKGKQYLVQLDDIAFAPHNSQFYKKNKANIQGYISNSIKNGKFYVIKGANNTVDLYKGHSLLNADFLSHGIAYMPNIANKASATHEQMLGTEKHAQMRKIGLWTVPNAVSGNKNSQVYDISAENGHKVGSVNGGVAKPSSSNDSGGETLTQKISHWFGEH